MPLVSMSTFRLLIAVLALMGYEKLLVVGSSFQQQYKFDEALEYYEQGQILIHAGQVEDSLPFYRAANRLYVNSTQFLYSLGSAELSNGLFAKAHSRFITLLDLLGEPSYLNVNADVNRAVGVDVFDRSNAHCNNHLFEHENRKLIRVLLEQCEVGMRSSPVSLTPFQQMVAKRQPRILPIQERPIFVIEQVGAAGVNTSDGDVIGDDDGALQLRPEFQEPFIVRNCLSYLDMEASVTDFFASSPHVAAGAAGSSPVVLLPRFSSLFGTHMVEMYPQNMLVPPNKKYTRSLREALEYISHPSGAYTTVDASDPGAYLQWSLNASVLEHFLESISPGNALDINRYTTDVNSKVDSAIVSNSLHNSSGGGLHLLSPRITRSLQEYIRGRYALWQQRLGRNDTQNNNTGEEHIARQRGLYDHMAAVTHWNMVLVGEPGAGMFYHEDLIPVGSFQLQLQGHKKWRICSPERESQDDEVDIATVLVGGSSEKGFETTESADVCYEGTVSAGDLVYYPPSWGHETSSDVMHRNDADDNHTTPLNIAVSSSIVLDTDASGQRKNDFHEFIQRSCAASTSGNDNITTTTTTTMVDSDLTTNTAKLKIRTTKIFTFSPAFCEIMI